MHTLRRCMALAAFLLLAPLAQAQTAAEVLERVSQPYEEAFADVDNFVVAYDIDGPIPLDGVTTYYERIEGAAEGEPAFRQTSEMRGPLQGTPMGQQMDMSGMSQLDPVTSNRLFYELFAETARLEDETTIDGEPVYAVAIDDLSPLFDALETGDAEESNVTGGTATLYVGQDDYLMRRMDMTMEMMGEDGSARELQIIQTLSDYQDELPLPGVTVMEMHGMLTPEERQQIEQQLPMMQQQMAQMPEDQRAMMDMVMMMMEAMLNDEFGMTSTLTELEVNEGIPAGTFDE